MHYKELKFDYKYCVESGMVESECLDYLTDRWFAIHSDEILDCLVSDLTTEKRRKKIEKIINGK